MVPTHQPSGGASSHLSWPWEYGWGGVWREAPAISRREGLVRCCLGLQRYLIHPPCRRGLNQGDVSSSLQPAMLMRLQWDRPAAGAGREGSSILHPFTEQPSLSGHFIWCLYIFLFPELLSLWKSADKETFSFYFLIFVLTLGAGRSILFVIRNQESCVLCATENRVLPERGDTNHEDTLLTLLLNKKLAWRRPENIGKWRGWAISASWICVCTGACSSCSSEIPTAQKVEVAGMVLTRD